MYVEWGAVDRWEPPSEVLVNLLCRIGDDIYHHHHINPMKNLGEFYCPSFSVVGYWRGDNDQSDMTMDLERINFRWKSFMARWVGFVTEGSVSVSRTLDSSELYAMSVECLQGVQYRRARIIP